MTDERDQAPRTPRAEDLFSVMFATSADAMVITRIADGTYLDVNDAFVRMSGRTREEILGGNSLQLDWIDPAEREALVRELREKGTAGPNEARVRDGGGRERRGSYSSMLIDFAGERCVLTSIRDVSDLYEAHDALREQETRWKTLIDHLPGVAWTTDSEMRYTSISGSIFLDRGNLPDDFLGTGVADSLEDPDERERSLAAHRRVLAGESLIYDADYGGISFSNHMEPLRDENGDVIGVVAFSMDISSRRENEESNRRYSERLSSLYTLEQEILSARSPEEIAQHAVTRIRQVVGCERASVVEFDMENQTVKGFAVSQDGVTSLPTGTVLPLDSFGPLESFRSGDIRSWDLTTAADLPTSLQTLRDEGMRVYLNVPLIADDELIGSLNLGSVRTTPFTDEELDAAREVAPQLALAIHQTRLHAKVETYAAELEQRLNELRRTDADRRRLLSRLVEAQEQERQSIASDIHDDSLQKMAAVGLRLDVLRRRLDDPVLAEEAHKLAGIVNLTIDRLRRLMFELWPAALEQHGLTAAIRVDLLALKEEQDVDVSLEDRFTGDLSEEMRNIAYRITQEAIANIRKHAKATKADVRLEDLEEGLRVRVRDNGTGVAPEAATASPPGHLGISAMRERAELAGGWLRVDTPVGGGTQIEFWLPVGDGKSLSGGPLQDAVGPEFPARRVEP